MPILTLLTALLVLLPTAVLADQVVSIGDGDAMKVMRGGRRVTVRLACIDTPETGQRPYGALARSALQRLVPVGSEVSLRVQAIDRYGRTVAEVFRGGTNVNLALVRQGQAFVFWQYIRDCEYNRYTSAEHSAESRGRGVWAVSGGITRPWDWRKQRRSGNPSGGGSSGSNSGGGASGGARPAGSVSPSPAQIQQRQTCRSIGSWARAQELLRQGHSHLDGDRDGEACESLH